MPFDPMGRNVKKAPDPPIQSLFQDASEVQSSPTMGKNAKGRGRRRKKVGYYPIKAFLLL